MDNTIDRWKVALVSLLAVLVFGNTSMAGPLSCSNLLIDQLAAGHSQVPQNPFNLPGRGSGTISCQNDNPDDAQRYLNYLEPNCIKDNWNSDVKCRNIETQLLWSNRPGSGATISGSEMLDKFEAERNKLFREKNKQEKDAASGKSTLPACDSQVVEQTLIYAANNSPKGKTAGFEVFKLKDPKQIDYNIQDDVRTCKATALTNAGSETMTFTLEKDGDNFYLEAR
jgi:hypothetical protein